MILTFNSVEELVNSFITKDGELNGYVPQYGFDATKLTYPVKIEVIDETGMFRLHDESKTTYNNCKLQNHFMQKSIMFGLIMICAFIFCMVFFTISLIGCASKAKCLEYENGYCKTEEVIYQMKRR